VTSSRLASGAIAAPAPSPTGDTAQDVIAKLASKTRNLSPDCRHLATRFGQKSKIAPIAAEKLDLLIRTVGPEIAKTPFGKVRQRCNPGGIV
jgi:hypothetical protein